MNATPDIDKIDDLADMLSIMESLKIPSKGLKTLDEMKEKVKKKLQSSEEKSTWTAKEVRILEFVS